MGPASDIYSLGATLYAVLVGRPPLRGQSVMETLRQTVHVEPEPPRRLDRSVPRDLERICLKALSKRPGGRYESASSMADDLRRFLEGHPIQLRPKGATGRVARWVRRRPARAVACLLAIAAVALIVFQQMELHGARDGRVLRRTINRLQEAELWKAVADGESRARAHPGDREGRRTLASTYHRLGDLLVNTDRLAEATWAYGRAVESLRQRVREEPGASALRVELAVVLESQGEVSWAIGRPHEAREAYRDALTVRRELAADHPQVPAYRDDLARTLRRLNQFEGDADRRPGT
jgi:tetratricopeptide (TPR) repeat protein